MNEENIQRAYNYLVSPIHPGPFCWCGHARGHSLGHCHECGQPFDTPGQQLTVLQLLHRIYRRRAYKNSAVGQKDMRRNFFGTWRFLFCEGAVFEEFEEAYNRATAII